MKAIVLAGGGGTRLWPLSRENFPKQFLRLQGPYSLLQKTILRLTNTTFIDDIVISTNPQYISLVQKQIDEMHLNINIHILAEPCRRNTAPAITLAIQFLQTLPTTKHEDTVLILPSDHLLEPESAFIHAIYQINPIAQEKKLITFGIKPTKPETGYGYIRIGDLYKESLFKVEKFIEKPNLHTAQQFIENPHYFWNSGMFLFSIETFWSELEKHCPSLAQSKAQSYEETISSFHDMPDISIDYALMEKSKEILVCPLSISWSDIGSWDSFYEILEKDAHQNAKIGNVFDIDTKNCLIVGGKRLISTVGVENLLIVETEDAIYISKKGESQRVKSLLSELIKTGKKETLSTLN